MTMPALLPFATLRVANPPGHPRGPGVPSGDDVHIVHSHSQREKEAKREMNGL